MTAARSPPAGDAATIGACRIRILLLRLIVGRSRLEVWKNPVTRERAVILELPWQNADGRGVAELTALPGALVMGIICTLRCMSASASSTGS